MRATLLLSCALAACAPIPAQTVSPEHDPQLLTKLFEDARSMEPQVAPAFACVSIREGTVDRDPAESLVDELAARWSTPVIPGSRCSLGGQGGTVVVPGVSGTGKWLRVTNLQCSDANHCIADVSYYVANLAAGGHRVAAERSRSGWQITPSEIRWIS
ncbi:MAG TPA: hypothetical protein VFI88_03465 [Sphingomicrobium sp.]|jgi:hypothetical protein|nr:hypothetical protein [Sphingomicrobium sp.]